VKKNSALWRRALFAGRGLWIAAREEASFRTELLAVVGGVILLYWTGASLLWWGVGILLMGAVLAAELLNSAVESLADLVSPEYHPLVARAKDCGAAAVLVLSFTAVLIAALLLWRYLHLGE
jgi:Diacylglycerol kinase